MSNISLLGFDVTTKNVKDVVNEALRDPQGTVVNTINPHSYVEQKSDREFHDALMSSDVLVPDGSGIVFAAKTIRKKNLVKIAGFDLFTETMRQLNNSNGSVFFLGSSDHVLDKIRDRAASEYPSVVLNTYSPPFKPEFSKEDIAQFVQLINEISPDVVFVGLTAPKQEKLIAELRENAEARMFSGIGAVFDFYAGTVKRPAAIWIKLHLEWLVRLLGEPKRLWRRNFVSTPIFIIDVLKEKFGLGK